MGRSTAEQHARSMERAQQRLRLVDGVLVAPIANHGTVTGYTYHGCRCGPCVRARLDWDRGKRSAQPAARAARRAAQLARRVAVPVTAQGKVVGWVLVAPHLPPEIHGTPSASDYYGCRCSTCVVADRARRAVRDRGRRR